MSASGILAAVDASRCSAAIRFPPVFAVWDRCRFGLLSCDSYQPFSPVAGASRAAGSMRNAADSFLGSLSTLARRLVVTASSNHAHSVADWHLTCAVLFVPTMRFSVSFACLLRCPCARGSHPFISQPEVGPTNFPSISHATRKTEPSVCPSATRFYHFLFLLNASHSQFMV